MSKVYLYPLSIRIWHWTNAFIIVVLIITGLQLRIPDIRIFSSYSFVTSLHKYTGFACAASFIFWIVSYIFTGGLIRHYILTFHDIKTMPKQAWYYMYGLFVGRESPFKPSPTCKFNPLQKMAYCKVMFFFTPVIIITGILFSDILYFLPIINAIGGIRVLDAIHVTFGYIFFIYLIVHVYMATLGAKPYTHIKTMFTGYEEEIEEHGARGVEPDSEEPVQTPEQEKPGASDN
jgi:thiosulfate reductase cytochrome b subunit